MTASASRRSYAIVGTGALGGYYGARLHHAGLEVRFLLNSDFDHVQRHGLKVESVHGDFSIPRPRAFARAQDVGRCDVVLISLKTTMNDALPSILPHIVKDSGVVLVMQNGLGVEDEAARIVGPRVHVLGGMAFLCSHKVGPGHIRHLDYGQVRLGEHATNGDPAGVTERVLVVADDFRRAGLPVEPEDDLLLARWKKLVWNIPYNGLSVVLNATTDRLMQNPETRALCEALMREVVRGAAAFGRVIDDGFVQQMLTNTDQMVTYKPSMMLDHEAGRPMEIEVIYGNPLRAARSRGVTLERVAMLYDQLKFIDAGASAPPRFGDDPRWA